MPTTAFAGSPPEARPAPARTVVLACSATKVLAARAAAFRLYDGPLWRTLRTYWSPGDPVRVYALSARYGLIPAETVIAAYDLELSAVVGQEVRAAGLSRSPRSIESRVTRATCWPGSRRAARRRSSSSPGLGTAP